jgi:hypothetical protein
VVRNCVVATLPRLAEFAPQHFARFYLANCMQHLHTVLRLAAPFDRSNVFSLTTPLERGIAFAALGNLAKSMTSPAGVAGLTPHLQMVAAAMKEMFIKSKKGAGVQPGCTEAVVCAGQLAQYLGPPWEVRHHRHPKLHFPPVQMTPSTASSASPCAAFRVHCGWRVERVCFEGEQGSWR